MNETIAATLKTVSGGCPAEFFNQNDVVQCEDFVFKSDEYRLIQAVSVYKFMQLHLSMNCSFMIFQYDIYCEDAEYKLALVGTVYNVGRFISMPFTGMLSDK